MWDCLAPGGLGAPPPSSWPTQNHSDGAGPSGSLCPGHLASERGLCSGVVLLEKARPLSSIGSASQRLVAPRPESSRTPPLTPAEGRQHQGSRLHTQEIAEATASRNGEDGPGVQLSLLPNPHSCPAASLCPLCQVVAARVWMMPLRTLCGVPGCSVPEHRMPGANASTRDGTMASSCQAPPSPPGASGTSSCSQFVHRQGHAAFLGPAQGRHSLGARMCWEHPSPVLPPESLGLSHMCPWVLSP